MSPFRFPERMRNRYRMLTVDLLARRSFPMPHAAPFISFTFDDFPRSAYTAGGKILKNYGLAGTYYVSLGMLNRKSDPGEIADIEMLGNVVSDGHELGCHTYSHPNPWEATPGLFESSILENRRAFSDLFPGSDFHTFAYPYGVATPRTKRIAGKYFACCRGGRQSFNSGRIDLNYLNACFIDARKKESRSSVKSLISGNREAKGWLIFVTHHVAEDPSPYGCTPDFFEEIVRCSVESGAVVLPVFRTFEALSGGSEP